MAIIHTTPRKSKKRKPTASQRELAASWDTMLKKYPTQSLTVKRNDLSSGYKLGVPAGRETPRIPSRDTGLGNATKRENPVYTGTMVKGIGTMHKSNAIPIFSDEQAVEIATMRRG